jgi:predicted RecA/RadA family phage recombinase
MTALSSAKEVNRKDGLFQSYPVAATTTIYKGATVMISSGYLTNAVDGSGNLLCGVAMETVDNSSGDAGDLECKVYKSGSFEFAIVGASQASVGVQAYVVDNQTVAVSTTNSVKGGTVVEYISSTKVRVLIDRDIY